jgi:para-aminobenzoate synthetase/4-amino-4-deoxychorismate lyase
VTTFGNRGLSRPGPGARFDDLQTRWALGFPAPDQTLTAHHPDAVRPVLDAVTWATEAGAWAYGYLAYEAAAGFDPALSVHPTDPDGPPLAWFGLVSAPWRLPVLEDTTQPDHVRPDVRMYSAIWRPEWTLQHYRSQVEDVRSHIAAGETYQTNLTVRMRGRVKGDPLELYRDLALSQRGAYNAYLDLGRFVVASASPELFFQRCRDEVLLRTMKGTASRGRDAEQDRSRGLALRADSKERAENVMIVDLMRNDIARIARTGTVRVPALLTVERYATVLQLTSDVTAQLRPGTGLAELFTALFPCGSVTGAPKARTMALIRELEDTPRGIYCGAIGWVAPPTEQVRARFSVAIRTAVIDRYDQTAVYGTGSGITWSSDPTAEHREVLAKTAILRRRRQFHLFETMRHQPGRGLRNREHHLRRLAASATHLGFRLDLAHLTTELDARLAPLAEGPDIRVRLRLDRDGSIGIDLVEAPAHGTSCVVGLDDDPLDPESWWLFHKTSLREPYEERRARRPDVDDVILVNTRGELTETTRATLAIRLDGRWYTPPLDSGCLPGTERARRLAEATLHERVLTPLDLTRADAIALLSSLRGTRPAAVVLPPETAQARIPQKPPCPPARFSTNGPHLMR